MSSAREFTEGNFRTGYCEDCGMWLQGNDQVWEQHRRVLHSDGWTYEPWIKVRSKTP